MQEENDVLLRQIKAFAQGLGYLLGAAGGKGGNEVVFPQKTAQRLPQQDELTRFLTTGQLAAGTRFLFSQRYAMAEPQFIDLGLWYFTQLNALTAHELTESNYTREAITAGLEQLDRIQRGEA